MNSPTILKKFILNSREVPKKTLYKYKINGFYKDFAWEEIKEKVFKIASFLLKSKVKKNDKIAILSSNRIEWALADYAILFSGGIVVPIYSTSTSGQIKYILKDSGCKIIFIENAEQYKKIKNFDFLEKIISFEKIESEKVVFLEKIILEEKEILTNEIHEVCGKINYQGIVTLIYTSGTTGLPKGVYLTHQNLLHNIIYGAKVLPVNEDDIFLSHLPLSHILERNIGHFIPMYYKAVIAYAEKIDTVADNLKEIKPTMFISVPRLYEKILEKIIEKVRESSFLKRRLFYMAKNTAEKYAEYKYFGNIKFSFIDKIKYNFFEKKVYSKLRDIFGGRIKIMISGGGKLPYEVSLFYNGIGFNLLEGYGLTETSPVISVNLLEKNKIGTVGKPLEFVEVKIAEDGEILVKGPNVTIGYHNKDSENENVFKEGYFCTGDIGEIDEDGFLKITDRKKDIIVTSGGKNIAPAVIENILKEDPFISEVMVYGDGKKYLTALIVPHFKAIEKWAEERDIKFSSYKDLVENERVKRLIMHRIEKRSESLARFEQIKKFVLLDREFSLEDEEVTPTLKIRRKIITEKFKSQLESLYDND